MKKRDYKGKLNQRRVAKNREVVSNIQMQGFWKGAYFIVNKMLLSPSKNYKGLIELMDEARMQIQKDKEAFKTEEFYNKFFSLLDLIQQQPENKENNTK